MIFNNSKKPFGSFALFFDGGTVLFDNDRPSLDVNVWVRRDKDASIDFGIRIPFSAKVNTAYLFVPYEFTEGIQDLHETLRDSELSCGIFNSETTMHIYGDRRYFSISLPSRQNQNNREVFYVVPTVVKEDQLVADCCGVNSGNVGRLFAFDIEKMRLNLPQPDGSKLYFRFRIPFVPLTEALGHTMGFGPDSFSSPLVPHTLSCYVAVNESRQLPHSIGRQLESSRFAFDKRYIVFIAEEAWEIDSYPDPYRIRQLESGIWGKYWPEADKESLLGGKRKYTVHQYNLKEGRNATLYIKMSRYKVTPWTIAAWVVALGLVGAVGDVFSGLFSLLANMLSLAALR